MELMFGLHLEAVLDDRRALTQTQQDLLRTLMLTGGRTAIVRKAADHRPHMLVSAVEVLPRDLAPLIILDASARVKYDYRLWSTYRGTLSILKRAEKRYEGLTVRHWRAGGGRSTVQANPQRYIEARN